MSPLRRKAASGRYDHLVIPSFVEGSLRFMHVGSLGAKAIAGVETAPLSQQSKMGNVLVKDHGNVVNKT